MSLSDELTILPSPNPDPVFRNLHSPLACSSQKGLQSFLMTGLSKFTKERGPGRTRNKQKKPENRGTGSKPPVPLFSGILVILTKY